MSIKYPFCFQSSSRSILQLRWKWLLRSNQSQSTWISTSQRSNLDQEEVWFLSTPILWSRSLLFNFRIITSSSPRYHRRWCSNSRRKSCRTIIRRSWKPSLKILSSLEWSLRKPQGWLWHWYICSPNFLVIIFFIYLYY